MNAAGAVVVALFVASCGGSGNRCSTEPVGSINVFFPGDTPSRDATLVVDRVTPISNGFRYDFRDGSPMTWIARDVLPVAIGKPYRFIVAYRPGAPDASSIMIFDGEMLLFAALTDQTLRLTIPTFELSVGQPVCGSRGSTKCHESLVNLPLKITHGGQAATIHHGDTAQLGDYEIKALTAQRVTYASRCADAGLPAVSLTISRVK